MVSASLLLVVTLLVAAAQRLHLSPPSGQMNGHRLLRRGVLVDHCDLDRLLSRAHGRDEAPDPSGEHHRRSDDYPDEREAEQEP
jgi:hypothetical protein